jgi:hypothetical protein
MSVRLFAVLCPSSPFESRNDAPYASLQEIQECGCQAGFFSSAYSARRLGAILHSKAARSVQ